MLASPDYQRRLRAVRQATTDRVGRYWASLSDYRDNDIDRFVRLAVPTVIAGQNLAARLTAEHLGGPVDREAATTARGVEPRDVYHRVGVKVWTVLSSGGLISAAVSQAGSLAANLAATDIQLAVTAQSRASLTRTGVARYRRVLSGSESCGLCEIAASHTYSTADLMPIHGGCDCTVSPVEDTVTYEPSLVDLTANRLAEVAAGVAPAALVATREHGELGPVLTWASDHFTGPDDI